MPMTRTTARPSASDTKESVESNFACNVFHIVPPFQAEVVGSGGTDRVRTGDLLLDRETL